MGNAITDRLWFRWVLFLVLIGSIGLLVVVGYPFTDKLLNGYSVRYYHYRPHNPVEVMVDTSDMPPAVAVPILMYHGVTYEVDSENTSLEYFIGQMEMLKREGYETITVDEFDRFRKGEFVLPPKPIVITFDDGRKDSYYTTDDIFKKLGFTATIFYASGPTIDGDEFYLTWDELRQLQKTGRWEIEAHGRYSHLRIPVDDTGVLEEGGRYLISKMYLLDEGRLETDEEYELRVEKDYWDSVHDLEEQLGITPRYFAIPLNNYGQLHPTNFEAAPEVNLRLMEKYFNLAFIEANSPSDVVDIHLPVYNFPDEDPYLVRRVEMKNMSPEDLSVILSREFPGPPQLTLKEDDYSLALNSTYESAGTQVVSSEGFVLTAEAPSLTGIVVFGQHHWEDYLVHSILRRESGDSVVLLFHYQDGDNYLSCGVSNGYFFMRAFVDGISKDLAPRFPFGGDLSTFNDFQIETNSKTADCIVNGMIIYDDVAIPLEKGAVGFKVWGESEVGSGTLRRLDVVYMKDAS